MVYILEIISLADFRHLGLLCDGAPGVSINPNHRINFHKVLVDYFVLWL